MSLVVRISERGALFSFFRIGEQNPGLCIKVMHTALFIG
jgi:hypothetical protein